MKKGDTIVVLHTFDTKDPTVNKDIFGKTGIIKLIKQEMGLTLYVVSINNKMYDLFDDEIKPTALKLFE
jgi:hypothetical protein